MGMRDTAEARAAIGEALRQPPEGTRVVQLLRFVAIPPEQMAGEVLDHLLGDEGQQSARERPGRRLRFVADDGRELQRIEIHPVEPDFEATLLAVLLSAISDRPIAVELLCDTETLLDGHRVVERWEGSDLLRAGGEAPGGGYREGASLSTKERQALSALDAAGFEVERRVDGHELVHQRSVPARPWTLLFLPLLVWFLPLAIVLPGLRSGFRDFFGRAVRGRRLRARYRFGPAAIEAVRESGAGDSATTTVPTPDILAVSWAPAGTVVDETAPGALRVVTREGAVTLPLPAELPPADERTVGAALCALVEATRERAG